MKSKSSHLAVSCATKAPSRRSKLCTAAITLSLLASNMPAQAQGYKIIDLGTLKGTVRSVGYGLNNLGQAVGVSSNPTAAIATLFSNGTTMNLNTLSVDVSVATAVNGFGRWSHLRTTNPIESTFATVRLRTQRIKGCGSRIATLTMAFRLGIEAQKHWRRLNGSALLPKVVTGVQFIDGEELEQQAA